MDVRARRLIAATAAFLAAAVAIPAQAASDRGLEASGGRSEHDRVVAFWTPARVAKAVPRDFEYDPASGRFHPVPAKRPGGAGGGSGGGGTSTDVLGASWTGGGAVVETTGKVLFALGSSYYVCSASVVRPKGQASDGNPDYSYVLTAAHCAYDETNAEFAENWMFIPDYDAAPVRLTSSGSFCAGTTLGCWTAAALVLDSGFAEAGGFTTEATLHDFAVAVVGAGGGSGQEQLDGVVGTQQVTFATAAPGGEDTYLFGYPAGRPYNGSDLVYSRGALGRDPYNGLTYRVDSDMTGGSSGGPWFTSFSGGVGTQTSVTSYGYRGQSALHGPILNGDTQAVYAAAVAMSTPGNEIVDVTP